MASTLRLAGGLLVAASAVSAGWDFPEIITRDVAIIGGGASGSYAAVRLREDYKKSIVVVEKAGRLVCHICNPDVKERIHREVC
jgi:NADPH-dependent glutamate synthase beta subunit-like oxidoreductase